MSAELTPEEMLAERDPGYVATLIPLLRLAMKVWFRSEVRGLENVPDGGALLVANHSGGMLAMDVPVIAVDFFSHFGADRPLYCLGHDIMFTGPAGPFFRRWGFLPAHKENAQALLEAGGVTIVFPGGDYDVIRPWHKRHVIDFNGRTGYVRTALDAGVPIVPAVSIGGHEAQLFLTRGEMIGRLLRLDKVIRSGYFPLSIGFPFGLTGAFPPNIPLPTKIVTQVLEPIDIEAEFGPDPDIAEVDAEVRRRMQEALDGLARKRRFPVLG
ncbi:lysophospholipid acyltransferase family protein [Nocardioides limicola]|uniref:lysophospholipid acyltransferase family protein n=1 Tax=Nocardioides limicola TaxID=2803368 RepID=UPI00193B045E|nr:lysophospholipid acyltransferase family protein [Nocardioides sp. DJM-14]